MRDIASLLGYEELNQEMEQLGQKLVCTTLELERLKAEAMEEMRKNKEYINHLIRLLKFAIQERDEARNQFQKLLNKTTPPLSDVIPLFQPETPLFKCGKSNSSITESNSLSEPYHGSSPVNSILDAVSSPEFTNINFVANQTLIQQCNHINSGVVSEYDQESMIIDTLAKGRVLPQKGKLLQAVLQAGPLLQPLMVAGPLPRWRNPPQLQPFQIPPVSIKGCETEPFSYKQDSWSLVPQIFAPLSAQIQSSPMLNCGSTSLMNGSGYSPLVKRQRF
ncbi:hypothetical protein ACS0TY_020500 [Phlomoides rotata]